MITAEEVKELETACEKLLKTDKVRHVAVINKLGKMVAGRFNPGIDRYLDEEKVRMVYMQLMLDLRMRQELDDILGPVDYITARRKKISIICVPTENYLIVISAERDANSQKIIEAAEKLFDIIDLK
ncbi:MAG: DUF6659 family protein [Nitrosopumilaceae archaeon]|nr:DUF6659 family protein [Nitrosopumilaceae archaeon]